MARRQEETVVIPTGRHGLPPDVVSAHQRERLLAATIDVIAKRGYRGTSVDHILKAARVGYVAYYELFEGKEDCFLAAFERIVEETREALVAAVDSTLPWAEQICVALGTLLELIATNPARARVALVEMQAAGATAYARYEATIDEAVPKLREGRILRPSEAAPLSRTLEEATIAGITWILHQRLVRGEAEAVGGLQVEVIQLALSPYLGEAKARQLAEQSTNAQA